MRTHCPYCALQCAMTLDEDGDAYRAAGDATFDVNAGELCVKGWTAAETLRHPQRLLSPLVREGGRLREASWNEALDRAAEGLRRVRERYGAAAVGVFGSGALTNEKAYALGKFARLAVGTPNFDYNGRFCMSSAAAAQVRAFGLDRGLPFPLEWIARTACLLVVGDNLFETMPPLRRYLDAQAQEGRRIVVDPRRTELARTANVHLQPAPGTDVAVANALLHVLVAEERIDRRYIGERTRGFEAVQRAVEREHPERAERRSGVPAEEIRRAARMLAEAPSSIILTGRGPEQHANGTDGASAYINLALALGLPGREHCGYGTLTGQGNGQGGREHGQKSDQLPGYRKIDDAAARAHVAQVWGVAPESLPGRGLTAYELLSAVGEQIHALVVMASNPVVSAPHASDIRRRLAGVEHLVVCDFFLSETAELAQVVLPSLQWAEETGTMTNLEGRVLLRERCVEPPPGPRSDLAILRSLCQRLGAPDVLAGDDPEEIFEELRRASAGGLADYGGITYQRLRDGERLCWPCPDPAHPGTPVLFRERFATPDGRAGFSVVEHRRLVEPPNREFPWYLTTGRIREQYLSGTQTRRVAPLRRAAPEPFVEMHPLLAAAHGVSDGEAVRLVSPRGSVVLRAKLDEGIRRDTLFVPFHWGGAQAINTLTSDALDPVSRMPAFKVCAVRMERVPTNG
ncbi:MAG: molybdopterin oxidoreductase family protein [bacterium]|nr:molybdopterin oxidoreductase family protein [bacterium]